MNSYQFELSFLVSGHQSVEELEEFIDKLADELYDLDGVQDPDLGASLTAATLDITMTIVSEDEAAAFSCAIARARSAIHAADGCTPGWEAHFEGSKMRRVSDLMPA